MGLGNTQRGQHPPENVFSWQQSSPSANHGSVRKTLLSPTVVPLTAQRSKRTRIKDFRPFAHKTLPLLSLVLIVLSLIGLLEYCMRRLPQAKSNSSSDSIEHYLPAVKWTEDSLNGPTRVVETQQPATITNDLPNTNTEYSFPYTIYASTFTAPADIYLSPTAGIETVYIGTVAQESYSNPIGELVTSTGVATPISGVGSYLLPSAGTHVLITTGEQESLTTIVTNTASVSRAGLITVASAVSGHYSESMGSADIVLATITSAYQISSASPTITASAISGHHGDSTGGVDIALTTFISTLAINSATPTTANSASVSDVLELTLSDLSSNGDFDIELMTITSTLNIDQASRTVIASANPAHFSEITSGVGAMLVTTFWVGTGTISTRLPMTTLPPNISNSQVPLTFVKVPGNYFLAQYLPTFFAVALRLALSYLHRSTKLVDPFFMLNEPEGAAAFDFYKSDHLGTEVFLAPFNALRARRWLLLWTAVIYAISQILIPLGAELTSIRNSSYIFTVQGGYGLAQGQAIWINPVIGRLIQGLLVFVVIMLVVVWLMLRRYGSGISSNPGSFATVASLMDHPITKADFSSIDQGLSKNMIERVLAGRRYRLDYYQAPEGSERYGIVPIDLMFENGSHRNDNFIPHGPVSDAHVRQTPKMVRSESPKSEVRKGIILLAFLSASSAALFGVVLAYYVNGDNTFFERFMDSQSFGPRFVLSALALLVKVPLVSLCAKTMSSMPFSRLHRVPRLASPDLLSPVPVTPLGAVDFALRRGEAYAVVLALAAGVLIECLLILIPSVPFGSEQIWASAVAGFYGCMACLAIIFAISVAGWVRLFRRQAEFLWPHNPGRVGAVALYVAGSRMAGDMAAAVSVVEADISEAGDHGKRRSNDVTKQWHTDVSGWGSRYDFRVRNGRWMVEYADGKEEERISDYDMDHREPRIPSMGMGDSDRLVQTGQASTASTLDVAITTPSPVQWQDQYHHHQSQGRDRGQEEGGDRFRRQRNMTYDRGADMRNDDSRDEAKTRRHGPALRVARGNGNEPEPGHGSGPGRPTGYRKGSGYNNRTGNTSGPGLEPGPGSESSCGQGHDPLMGAGTGVGRR